MSNVDGGIPDVKSPEGFEDFENKPNNKNDGTATYKTWDGWTEYTNNITSSYIAQNSHQPSQCALN